MDVKQKISIPAKKTAHFTSSSHLPKILQGKEMLVSELEYISNVKLEQPFEVLAKIENKPIWITSLIQQKQYKTEPLFAE